MSGHDTQMASATPSRYVPPHLRNRPGSSSDAGPSTAPSSSSSFSAAASSSPRRPRVPWSHASAFRSSEPDRSERQSSPALARALAPATENDPIPGQPVSPARAPRASAPSLYVYGDSFVGPFKLLRDDCARVQTFKGASAKGLDNPKSIKQVSSELVPALNALLAPPPYVYIPSAGRSALLVFGNVDLQINYLYQLQHKPISAASFTAAELAAAPGFSAPRAAPAHDAPTGGGNADASEAEHILATATETSLRGPALGPTLFVDAVLSAYTSWLRREILDGPIGVRAREAQADADPSTSASTSQAPRPPGRRGPTRVLVAAALPPLTEDDSLYRLPEKYVERLEEDHVKAARALEAAAATEPGGSRTPWARAASPAQADADADHAGTGTGTGTSAGAGAEADGKSTLTATDAPAAVLGSDTPASPTPPSPSAAAKTSIAALLTHAPPLCTRPVRAHMTARFNAGLRAFCARSRGVLGYVDVSAAMLAGDGGAAAEAGPATAVVLPGARWSTDAAHVDAPSSTSPPTSSAAASASPSVGAISSVALADRATWACPVDPSNIHPLWEPTLPLWVRELARAGVPTHTFAISKDAEETFRAYEADKRRRTEGQEFADGEEGEGVGRLKLRDE
ncbi:hypothetical protein Q5752_006442 [Cryptotrichosporon argae]